MVFSNSWKYQFSSLRRDRGALECLSHGRDTESKAIASLPPQGPWTQGQEWTRGESPCGEETQSVSAL